MLLLPPSFTKTSSRSPCLCGKPRTWRSPSLRRPQTRRSPCACGIASPTLHRDTRCGRCCTTGGPVHSLPACLPAGGWCWPGCRSYSSPPLCRCPNPLDNMRSSVPVDNHGKTTSHSQVRRFDVKTFAFVDPQTGHPSTEEVGQPHAGVSR